MDNHSNEILKLNKVIKINLNTDPRAEKIIETTESILEVIQTHQIT